MWARRVEFWVWVLIYAGLIGFGLGVALHREGASAGGALIVASLGMCVLGAVLIWVRSRMRPADDDPALTAVRTASKNPHEAP
jgi:hypothetical protein